ncbi:MAG: 16S rRNA (cytosine(967)-C(5))-methyltransferase RsmB [Proteobacteria bacterium]|nr:16S rRNA (cytosine(967)-C(5))-methyltransferase RsmB [Pseudomonadota bacterium]
MTGASRTTAHRVLGRVCGGGYADILLESALSGLAAKERPLTTELVYGVLRQMVRIDYVISSFASVKPEKMEHKVLNSLRLGVYQLLFLSGVPPHAAINESVELVSSLGRKRTGFVNGVLRRISVEGEGLAFPDIAADPVIHISTVYSHPEWIVRRWVERYGVEESIELCKANLVPGPKCLRINTLEVSSKEERAALIEEFTEAGFSFTPDGFSADALILEGRGRFLKEGGGAQDRRYYFQDSASQLVSCLLSPTPGSAVLDACAAPGGKSSHIAALMGNSGSLVAVERNGARAKLLRATLKRLGVTNATVLSADSELALNLSEEMPKEFDFVLCDAPCSGLGVLARAPDIKLRRKSTDIAELARRQKRLIENLGRYVLPGGTLVYSVCSNEPEESTEIVEAFIAANPHFSIENANEFLSPECAPFVDERGFLRTYSHKARMDGFFAARLKRGL